MDQVGLNEGFGRRRSNLEGFKEWCHSGHGLGHPFHETGWSGGAWSGRQGKEIFEGFG